MGRFKELGAWVVAIMLAGAYGLTGGMKLIGAADMVASFQRWGYDATFMYAVGVVEVAAAIAMLIPATAFYGAIVITVVMAGAIGTHLTHGEHGIVIVPFTLGVLALWLAWTRRPSWLGGHLGTGGPQGREFAAAMPEDQAQRPPRPPRP